MNLPAQLATRIFRSFSPRAKAAYDAAPLTALPFEEQFAYLSADGNAERLVRYGQGKTLLDIVRAQETTDQQTQLLGISYFISSIAKVGQGPALLDIMARLNDQQLEKLFVPPHGIAMLSVQLSTYNQPADKLDHLLDRLTPAAIDQMMGHNKPADQAKDYTTSAFLIAYGRPQRPRWWVAYQHRHPIGCPDCNI